MSSSSHSILLDKPSQSGTSAGFRNNDEVSAHSVALRVMIPVHDKLMKRSTMV